MCELRRGMKESILQPSPFESTYLPALGTSIWRGGSKRKGRKLARENVVPNDRSDGGWGRTQLRQASAESELGYVYKSESETLTLTVRKNVGFGGAAVGDGCPFSLAARKHPILNCSYR